MRVLLISNRNISETSGWISVKFHLKHHRGWERDALDFGSDWISTLHGYIKEQTLPLMALCFRVSSDGFFESLSNGLGFIPWPRDRAISSLVNTSGIHLHTVCPCAFFLSALAFLSILVSFFIGTKNSYFSYNLT